MVMIGIELPLFDLAKPIAFEIDLPAFSALIIEVQEYVTNGPPLQGDHQRGDTGAIVGRNRSNLLDFEVALLSKPPGIFLGGESQCTCPRFVLLLKGDN